MDKIQGRVEKKHRAAPFERIFSAIAVTLACASNGATAGEGAEGVHKARVAVDGPTAQTQALSLEELVSLAQKTRNPDIVIDQIRKTGTYFQLSAADVISLRERGVPLAIIEYLLAAERRLAVETHSNSRPQKQGSVPPANNAKQWTSIPALYLGL